MAKILVTGGAGYIGSHMVNMLVREHQHEVIVLDNLSTGHKDAVLNAELIVADLLDRDELDKCFRRHTFDAVMHFASLIQVGESIKKPAKYYHNNVAGSLNLLDVMLKNDVKVLIFSSSAAVYGNPQATPISVDHPKNPISPYGRSKWMIEQALQDYDKAYNFRSISLRYFNAAGADVDGRLAERHDPETHLIPLALRAAMGSKKALPLEIYGSDYPTKDGTCIRDYVHVVDLCQAHLLAMHTLLQGGKSNAYNLGSGAGYSVREVIRVAEEVTGKNIPVKEVARRAGDPAVLVAETERVKKALGWQPKYMELKTIVQHAWKSIKI